MIVATEYFKMIDCPEHPEQTHKAKMLIEPSDHAGFWECPKGVEDYHDCLEAVNAGQAELEVEEGEVDTMRNGEHDTYPVRYYVCAGTEGCGAIDG